MFNTFKSIATIMFIYYLECESSMAKKNPNFANLPGAYLFSEMAKKVAAWKEAHQGVPVYSLGVGNTTEPIPPSINMGLVQGATKLATRETYTGYGDEQGDKRLRKALTEHYKRRGVTLDPSEIFVADGAKGLSYHIQAIFGHDNVVAVQDPAYPVPLNSNVIVGRGGKVVDGKHEGIVYLPCTEENGFFPMMPDGKVDLIYLIYPNNPTGIAATREQLQTVVDYARENKAVIIHDAAYSSYTPAGYPVSIFEVPGADKCAVEISSFSKDAGFTGVRLGWIVVPKALTIEDTVEGELNSLWNSFFTRAHNGASNIAQEGGLAILAERGQRECVEYVDSVLGNGNVLRAGLGGMGFKQHGGNPYLWVKVPGGDDVAFTEKMLEEAHVVVTPGSGFGPNGRGYIRISPYGHRENIEAAMKSIKTNLKI